MAGETGELALTILGTTAGQWLPHVPPGSPFRADVRSIVLVKPCCIGDVIQISPVVASLRAAFPAAAIDLATSPWSRVAAETNPELRAIVELPPAPLRALPRVCRALRAGRYDLCVVLDRSPVYGVAAMLARIPERCGFDSLGRGFALNRRVAVPTRIHELDLALSVVEALGLPVASRLPTYHVPEEDRLAARVVLERCGVADDARLAVLAPGGGRNPGAVMMEKRWRPEGYARVAERCLAAGMAVALVGGPGDSASACRVTGLVRGEVHDLVGRTAFRELAAVLERASLYVGNDSGTTHLAAAVGCPTVAVFGPTDPARYGPWGARVAVVAATPGKDDPGRGMVRNPWFVGRAWQSLVGADQVWDAVVCVGGVP